jgi:acetyl-CoA carboxylase carboxyl transferase subunit alpha
MCEGSGAMAHLDFEAPLVELEERIAALKALTDAGAPEAEDIDEQIQTLQAQADDLQRELYADLDVWKKVQLSRHPDRPYLRDYLGLLVEDFVELHGDRSFRDDPAIISGFGRFNSEIVAIVGHQKGRTAKDKAHRNFGMAHPEGYRKAIRVMKLAEQAGRPVLSFIDTPGAYPGVGAEERGQAEAIGHAIETMSQLRVPVVSTVVGEGGSGGALAIGVANRVLMLEYATYSVITPEGCASILWRDGSRAPEAAKQLRLLASDAKRLGVVDEVVPEPPGGAHRRPEVAAQSLGEHLSRHLDALRPMGAEELVEQRYQRFRALGAWQ